MTDSITLTDEQVENWRRVMITVIGPYATLMPRKEIEKMAAMMQKDINACEEEREVSDE